MIRLCLASGTEWVLAVGEMPTTRREERTELLARADRSTERSPESGVATA